MAGEAPARYDVSNGETDYDDAVIEAALRILESRMRQPGVCISGPKDVKDYLRLRIGLKEHESFCALWLDARHRVISFDEVFRGALTMCAVHPREVVKDGLRHNAESLILAHNHPSGNTSPSVADKTITNRLKDALALVEVNLLDHIVVSGSESYSFAEHGLI